MLPKPRGAPGAPKGAQSEPQGTPGSQKLSKNNQSPQSKYVIDKTMIIANVLTGLFLESHPRGDREFWVGGGEGWANGFEDFSSKSEDFL